MSASRGTADALLRRRDAGTTKSVGRALLRIATCGALALGFASVRAGESVDTRALVGVWRLAWPHVDCQVVLEIKANGSTILTNGPQTTRSVADLAAATAVDGFETFPNGHVESVGDGGCKLDGGYPIIGLSNPSYVRVLAQGDRLALCAFDNVGGCNQWYERVKGPATRRRVGEAPGFAGAVARAIHAGMPESPGLFELSPKDPVPVLMPDGKAVQIDCPLRVGYYAMGYVDGGSGQLYVAACPDGKRLSELATKVGTSKDVKALQAQIKDEAEIRRYGLSYSAETSGNGDELFFFPAILNGVDGGMMMSTAVLIERGSGHAIVAQLVVDGTCEPRDPYAASAFCQDRAAALKAIVKRLARDPAAAVPAR